MSQKSEANKEYLDAVMSGDNLSQLKAQRKLIAIEIVSGMYESSDLNRMHATNLNITKEIMKIEGSQDKQSDEDLEEMSKIEEFANDFKRGNQ